MSDLRMELIQGQLNDIEENVRSIKATWGNTIMTLDNIKTSLKADRQKAIEEAYKKGFEAGQHEATTLEYQQGLDDAWETIREIARTTYAQRSEIFDGLQDILSIMRKFSPSEVTAKIREYERQKADEIRVGDEMEAYEDPSVKMIVLNAQTDTISGFNRCGTFSYRQKCEWRKTGRHFPQVAELLEAMKESGVTE